MIKSFIYSLTAQDVLPEYIIFYNGGVKLITQDAQSVEDLEELKQQGVKVLACGTCVDYYGLKDQIKVAEITDMFHIVELLRKAQRVVRP